MTEQKFMYRIVMTCWDGKDSAPYTDRVMVHFETEDAVVKAMRYCVKQELETLNEREMEEIDLDYPSEVDAFKADFDGDEFDAIIRMWEGDDYWPITGYSIEKIEILSTDSWRYREGDDNHGYYVYANKNGNRFAVECGDEQLCVRHSFEKALDFIDEEILGGTTTKEEKYWSLPVTWEVCGFVKVKAKTHEEAIKIFKETSDDIPLPMSASYVDGSFHLSSSDPEYIELYNKR